MSSEQTPFRARAFVLENGQTVVSDVTIQVTRNAREWVVFALIVALAVLFGFALSPFRDKGNTIWQQPNVPTGLPSRYEPGSPVPTAAPTGTMQAVYIVLTAQWYESPTARPTSKPFPTDAPVPDCMTGTTIPGSVCRAYLSTSTVVVFTPIPFCPTLPATPVRNGRDCIVPS